MAKRYRYNLGEPFGGFMYYAECDKCGDDVGLHEWVETRKLGLDNPIINCDRI